MDSEKSKAKVRLFADRPSRGKGQECTRPGQGPRTQFFKLCLANFLNYGWQIFYYFLGRKYLR